MASLHSTLNPTARSLVNQQAEPAHLAQVSFSMKTVTLGARFMKNLYRQFLVVFHMISSQLSGHGTSSPICLAVGS
jgi:hypothetical protein